jgi:hypothetical protein
MSLVLRVHESEYITIYDRLDGASPPIVIRAEAVQGKIKWVIDADQRFGVVRSDAKNKTERTREAKSPTEAVA